MFSSEVLFKQLLLAIANGIKIHYKLYLTEELETAKFRNKFLRTFEISRVLRVIWYHSVLSR